MMDFDQSNFGEDPDQECGQLERLEELFSVLDLAESQVSFFICINIITLAVINFPSLAKVVKSSANNARLLNFRCHRVLIRP